MRTKITIQELVDMCTEKGLSLDTNIVIGDIDNWNKPLLYEFEADAKQYTSGATEIVLSIYSEEEEEWPYKPLELNSTSCLPV